MVNPTKIKDGAVLVGVVVLGVAAIYLVYKGFKLGDELTKPVRDALSSTYNKVSDTLEQIGRPSVSDVYPDEAVRRRWVSPTYTGSEEMNSSDPVRLLQQREEQRLNDELFAQQQTSETAPYIAP
jgi:hypothetical protein